jgi:hypothetical protein
MDLQTKHTNKLIYFKTSVVNKVEDIRKKMAYGEQYSCCIENLYAAIKLINRLDCYCFPAIDTVTTTTNGSYSIIESSLTVEPEAQYFLYNGTEVIAELTTVGGTATSNLIDQLLALTSLSYTSSTDINDDVTFLVDVDCEVSDLYITNSIGGTALFTFTKDTLPVCEYTYTECFNCTEDSELNKMYQIVQSLLK